MIIGNLILAIANVINLALSIFVWLIIIRALVSWFSPDPYNVFFQFLYRITEPVLSVVRAAMPNLGGIDISPKSRWPLDSNAPYMKGPGLKL